MIVLGLIVILVSGHKPMAMTAFFPTQTTCETASEKAVLAINGELNRQHIRGVVLSQCMDLSNAVGRGS